MDRRRRPGAAGPSVFIMSCLKERNMGSQLNGNGVGLQDRPKQNPPKQDLRFQNYTVAGASNDEVSEFHPDEEVIEGRPHREVIEGRTLADLVKEVLEIGKEWPKRVGDKLVVVDARGPVWLDTTSMLMAWLDSQRKIDWKKGSDLVPQQRLFDYLRMTLVRHDLLELLPHWPPVPGVLYVHRKPPVSDGTYLTRLIAMFAPATELDRQLIEAFFLGLFWGGRAGGRPGWLITGPEDDPERGIGVGKSSLAEAAALLVGGMMDVAAHDDIVTIQKRLFSPPSRHLRLARLDNLKETRFSWAELEALITAVVISGYQLRRGEARRPNLLTWVLTLNGASLSRDVAKRFVNVKLARPTYSPTWRRDLETFITDHRWQIIADIGSALAAPAPALPADLHSRWGDWEAGVLARLPEPAALLALIQQRQEAVDDDSEETELVRSHFRDELQRVGRDPDRVKVFVPSGVAADWLKAATKQHRQTNKASAYLRQLAIPELRKSKHDGRPGWLWQGVQADENARTEKPFSPSLPHKSAGANGKEESRPAVDGSAAT